VGFITLFQAVFVVPVRMWFYSDNDLYT